MSGEKAEVKFDSHSHNDIVIASFLINGLSLALPLIMMQVYDRILYNESLTTLTWLVMGGVTAIFMESVLRYIRDVIGGLLAVRYEYQTTCNTVKKLLDCRLEEFEKEGGAKHLESLGMIGLLKNFYSGQIFQILLDIPFALMFLIAIFYLGGSLVWFPLSLCVAFVAVVYYFKDRFKKSADEKQSLYDKKYRFITQLLDGIHSIKAMSMEEQFLRRFENKQYIHTRSSLSHDNWKALPTMLGALFAQLAMFGTILFGGSDVISGNMTIGALTACMMLASRTMQPLQMAVSFWYNFSQAKLGQERLQQINAMNNEVRPLAEPLPFDLDGKIELKNLTFKYSPESKVILNEVDLTIPEKSMVCVTGPPLSGTTSLLYLMMGKLTPTQGSVMIDGMNVHEYDHRELSGRIIYLTSDTALFKGNIIENITMFNPHLHTIALQTAFMLGLDQMVAPLQRGYETSIDSRSTRFLPTSLVHRIGFARALTLRPRIILTDKTTVSMDRESELLFLDIIERLRESCTIVCASEWPVLLDRCDQQFHLENGILSPVDKSASSRA